MPGVILFMYFYFYVFALIMSCVPENFIQWYLTCYCFADQLMCLSKVKWFIPSQPASEITNAIFASVQYCGVCEVVLYANVTLCTVLHFMHCHTVCNVMWEMSNCAQSHI